MIKNNFKRNIFFIIIFTFIFVTDRLSKLYILHLAQINDSLDLFITPYLNFYLIWNKGIAFGLFSFDQNFIYNLITFLIIVVTTIIKNVIKLYIKFWSKENKPKAIPLFHIK